MTQESTTALERLRGEMLRPPFHGFLQPQAVEADAGAGVIAVQLSFRPDLARAPNEQSFHGGVIASLIDLAGHAAVAIKIGRMAPTIDLRIDYLRPSNGDKVLAKARVLKLGRTVATVDIDVLDGQSHLIAVGRGSYSTAQ
jgi:uncharacterized protein (TIGR00369 family)